MRPSSVVGVKLCTSEHVNCHIIVVVSCAILWEPQHLSEPVHVLFVQQYQQLGEWWETYQSPSIHFFYCCWAADRGICFGGANSPPMVLWSCCYTQLCYGLDSCAPLSHKKGQMLKCFISSWWDLCWFESSTYYLHFMPLCPGLLPKPAMALDTLRLRINCSSAHDILLFSTSSHTLCDHLCTTS